MWKNGLLMHVEALEGPKTRVSWRAKVAEAAESQASGGPGRWQIASFSSRSLAKVGGFRGKPHA
jgi:hypothetical protein